jgi:hypothetical protein
VETLANRIRNIKIESVQTPTISRSSVKSQYFLLVALILTVAGIVYALALYGKQKNELKRFSGPEACQCENSDFEKIRAKLESLDNQVKFALLGLSRKSRKRKH